MKTNLQARINSAKRNTEKHANKATKARKWTSSVTPKMARQTVANIALKGYIIATCEDFNKLVGGNYYDGGKGRRVWGLSYNPSLRHFDFTIYR